MEDTWAILDALKLKSRVISSAISFGDFLRIRDKEWQGKAISQ